MRELNLRHPVNHDEEILLEKDHAECVLYLTNDQYEEFADRSGLAANDFNGKDFMTVLLKTDANFYVYTDIYADGKVQAEIYMDSKDLGCHTYPLRLTDREALAVKKDAERLLGCPIKQAIREANIERIKPSRSGYEKD